MSHVIVSGSRWAAVVAMASLLGACVDQPANSSLSAATVASASDAGRMYALGRKSRSTVTRTSTVTIPPTISGTPITTVVAGSAYSFTPKATAANGSALTFSIKNMPAWASFSSSTGQISGTPASSYAGSYANIIISVSDGTATTSLAAFSIAVTQPGGTAKLSWTVPTVNADGSAIADLAGYRIYYGTNATTLSGLVDIANAATSNYVVGNLAAGTHYFAIKAYNSSGTESALSVVVSTTI